MKLFLKLSLLFLILTTLNPITLLATDGCYVTTGVSEPRVYYSPQSGTSQPRRFYTGNLYYVTSCNAQSGNSQQYAVSNGSPAIPVTRNTCYANYIGSGSGYDNSGNYTLNGTPIDFSVYDCPIDDSITYLLFTSILLKMPFWGNTNRVYIKIIKYKLFSIFLMLVSKR